MSTALRPWPDGMRVVGLTGGIASGKSTVSGMLRELGAAIIDADEVARDVVAKSSDGLRAVAERFGDVLTAEGTLDRAKLGARVFSNPEERKALNALLHPLIQAEVLRQTQALWARGERVAVYDAPLIVENGLHALLDGLIVVSVPVAVQKARLQTRNGLSAEEAQARLDAQLPLEEKVRHATWVVDNAGTLEQTRQQVVRIWEAIRA